MSGAAGSSRYRRGHCLQSPALRLVSEAFRPKIDRARRVICSTQDAFPNPQQRLIQSTIIRGNARYSPRRGFTWGQSAGGFCVASGSLAFAGRFLTVSSSPFLQRLRGNSLPRYFFDLRQDDGVVSDVRGQEFASLEEAEEHGRRLAIELNRNASPGALDGGQLVVVDSAGNVLREIPLGRSSQNDEEPPTSPRQWH
jgi:hypothetical protein